MTNHNRNGSCRFTHSLVTIVLYMYGKTSTLRQRLGPKEISSYWDGLILTLRWFQSWGCSYVRFVWFSFAIPFWNLINYVQNAALDHMTTNLGSAIWALILYTNTYKVKHVMNICVLGVKMVIIRRFVWYRCIYVQEWPLFSWQYVFTGGR